MVEPTSSMLHTKYQGHWPFGSRGGFERLLPYMGMAVSSLTVIEYLSD